MGTGLRPELERWVKERQCTKFRGSQPAQDPIHIWAYAGSPPCQWHACQSLPPKSALRKALAYILMKRSLVPKH